MPIFNFWKNMFNFKDKTDPDSFWLGVLINGLFFALIYYGLELLTNHAIEQTDWGYVIGIVYFIPFISAMVRRLHDRDKSAWYLIWIIIPFVLYGELMLKSVDSEKYSDIKYV